MKRVLTGVLAFCVLMVVVLAPGLGIEFGDDQGAENEPTRITTYAASFEVSADATMRVTEVITVSFPDSPARRGIFRFFDRRDPNAPGLRREPRDIGVTRDGAPEPYAEYDESNGRYSVLRIGRESRTLPPGEHIYVITYVMDDVLLPVDDTDSRFYWNLIPGGWGQAIDEATLRVELPADTTSVRCAVGAGSVSGCTAEGQGTRSLVITVSGLAPRTPVSVSAELPMAAPEPPHTIWWAGRWDPVLGTSLLGLLAVLGLAVAAGYAGVRLSRGAHEVTPGYPLMYSPPEGIGPAQAQYILTEGVDRNAFVSTMMYAGELGLVELQRGDQRWTMTGVADAPARPTTDPVTQGVLDGLGVNGGRSFVADRKMPDTGLVLQSAIATQKGSIRRWALDEGLLVVQGLGEGGRILILVAAIAAVGLAVFNPLTMSVVALVPGAFALGGVGLIFQGAATRRTAAGRDLWSRAGGFRRVLETPSSQVRFDFSARRELYTAYLPWAVAFGVADQWAAKYRTEMAAEPPVPPYFAAAYVGAHGGDFVSDMISDFDSTVQSSISAYQSSIASSSSSGGFSGGGGGGGGGGGSW